MHVYHDVMHLYHVYHVACMCKGALYTRVCVRASVRACVRARVTRVAQYLVCTAWHMYMPHVTCRM